MEKEKDIGIDKELNNILSTMYEKEILIELDKLLKILLTHNIEVINMSELRFTKYPCFRLVLSRKGSGYHSYFLYFCFYDEKYVLIQGLERIFGGEVFLIEFNSKLEKEPPNDFTPYCPTKTLLTVFVNYS